MAVLYPYLYYIELCYRETALYLICCDILGNSQIPAQSDMPLPALTNQSRKYKISEVNSAVVQT